MRGRSLSSSRPSRLSSHSEGSCFSSSDEASNRTTPGMSKWLRGDAVGTFLRIYRAVLDKCLQQQPPPQPPPQQQQPQAPPSAADDRENENQDSQPYYLLLAPVARLIGLFCATRVSVQHLRALLVLAEDPGCGVGGSAGGGNTGGDAVLVLARLHILRALRDAAEDSAPLHGVLDRPGPETFFSFGGRGGVAAVPEGRREAHRRRRAGEGLSCTLHAGWPFKHDFGVACWFRAESFASRSGGVGGQVGEDLVLFSTATPHGARISISFEAHAPAAAGDPSAATAPDAATLIISVADATATGARPSPPRRVRLGGCVLSSRTWYHVAVRLSRPHGGMLGRLGAFAGAEGSKDRVSVLLNGAPMLSERLRMPRLLRDADGPGGGGSVFGGHAAAPRRTPTTLRFLEGFDGQAGALYVFKEPISHEALQALYRETAAGVAPYAASARLPNGGGNNIATYAASAHCGTFADDWDTDLHGKMFKLVKAVGEASMLSDDLGDVLLPSHPVFTGAGVVDGGRSSYSRRSSDLGAKGLGEVASLSSQQQKKILFDVLQEKDLEVEATGVGGRAIPAELTHASFGSKLLLVWDPRRVISAVANDGGVTTTLREPHAGAHVTGLEGRGVITWSFESVRDTIGSLGGVGRLLPLFKMLAHLQPARRDGMLPGMVADATHLLVPTLLSLVASFIREHGVNACELFRCGGIHVIERLLLECKKKDLEQHQHRIDNEGGIGHCYHLGVTSAVSQLNAEALLDLWQASRLNFALETTYFSRILFNIPLLLGGLAISGSGGSTMQGSSRFHEAILPVLSEIAMLNPEKVRDCVGTGEILEVVNEYANICSIGSNKEEAPLRSSFLAEPAAASSTSSLVIDTLLGMVAMMLSQRCPTQDLSPLLMFVTYNLDLDLEAGDNGGGDQNTPAKSNGVTRTPSSSKNIKKKRTSLAPNNQHRYKATVQAISILFFLLQKQQPPVPNLIVSLADIFDGNGSCVASWMLCCLVNSLDDTIRGLGVKCLAAYLRRATASAAAASAVNMDVSNTKLMTTRPLSHDNATAKIHKTMRLGLEAISYSANNILSIYMGRANFKVIYKLLWHLLKTHRDRLGEDSNAALMYLLVGNDEDSAAAVSSSTSVQLADIVVTDESLGGFRLNLEELHDRSSRVDHSRQCLHNKYGVSTVLRLLRFLPNHQKELWLFDLLAFLLESPQSSMEVILSCDDWQHALFQLVAEVLDEIYGDDDAIESLATAGNDNTKSNTELHRNDSEQQHNCQPGLRAVNTETLSKPSVRTRYDLSLKLYSTLLGHCVRQGDEKAYKAVETAASLQRVDVNGPEIFSIVLTHLFADLIEKGTLDSWAMLGGDDGEGESGSTGRNRALKRSAGLVTQAILSNGASGLDMSRAVKQWRCLRHLTALTVAVVTESGFGIVQLFDYRNQDASAIDGITGGMYGIRLDNLVSGVNAFEALAAAKLHTNTSGRHKRDRYRYVCVVLASQALTLLDAFVFPDNLDSAGVDVAQLHGLALVRSTEPRLGQSQGTLLASLVRLSLVLLAYLEPSSVKFLQACSRLRCFLHWVLEILRESVTLGGYSQAFHELTAPLDRIVLAIVLQSHRALSRCSVVLAEMESSPWEKYFPDEESRHKSQRRLFRAVLELREIVLAAYRGRNEVLRAALSPQAHEALSRGLEEATNSGSKPSKTGDSLSKEASLRAFLENDWVSGYHDVDDIEGEGNIVIPEQIANGQIYQSRPATTRGRLAICEIASESTAITKEYSALLNAPFNVYCENQRKWAETDAVREREYEGDVSVKHLSIKYRSYISESHKSMLARCAPALRRLTLITQLANDPWDQGRHWKFTSYTDLLYRRIVFRPNRNFEDHSGASYELTLGKDREGLQREEAARKEREVAEAALRAAIVPYKESDTEDEGLEGDELNKSENEGFLGWGADGADESNGEIDGKSAESNNDEDDASSIDCLSNSERENTDESEWNQVESIDESSEHLDPFAWARKFMWAEGERFVHSFESTVIVSIQTTRAGTLLLTSHGIYFHQTEDTVDVMTKEKIVTDNNAQNARGPLSRQDSKWKLSRLTDVHGRRYMLKAQALELFFSNMEGLFVTFNGIRERDLFHAKLRGNCKAPLLRSFKSLNPRVVFKKSKLTELWQRRRISNFQYIMALNLMAGRTFNDITQYPVFPWVLADYTSETLDLSNPKVYRDLSKPVGALNPERLAQLIDRYNDLDDFPEEEKFLYGSHYSSPGVVLHYLMRQEPYTSMHIALQSGRFDCADRLFFDMGGCWRSCNTSTSDVKELLPEFFTCPEIFENTNKFPFGETQSKMSIDSVKLPPWAKGSPHEFIRLHRLALESEYVSNNLHHWIDLIFGYKQRGPAALAAHNVFHYLSYEGSVDIDKVTDELERKAIEGHIQNFGQTPSQLITKEMHPIRSHHEEEPLPLFKDLCLENMRCDTPRKQFGGPKRHSVAGAIMSLHSLGDSIFAIHSDFTICSYKLNNARGAIPFYFKNEKARVLESKYASLCHSITRNDHYLENVNSSEFHRSEAYHESQQSRSVSFAIALGANTSNNSSDPSYLLMSCGYFDDCVKIHSFDSLQLLSSQNGGHRGRINCIEVGNEGEMMVTGGADATCRIWVVDHDVLAAAIADGGVKSTMVQEGLEETKCFVVHVLLGHVSPVCCVAISTKLDVVVSGSQDGSICIHNIRSGKFIRSLHIAREVHESCGGNGISVKKIVIHVDGYFVAHLCDGSLHVLSINGQHLCSTHIGEQLNTMIICPKSQTLITGGELGSVRIWSFHDLSLQCTVDVKKHGAITSLILTQSESQFLCTGSSNGMLSVVSRKGDATANP